MPIPYNLTSHPLATIRAIFFLMATFLLFTFRLAAIAAPHEESQATPLLAAALAGDIPRMKVLIASGANANEANIYGNTPLHYALRRTSIGRRHGRVAVVTFLVKHGANVNSCTKNGITPLMDASNIGDTDALKYLVENGAQIDLADNDGRTALALAASRLYDDIMIYLVAHNANVATHDVQGRTPLMEAIDSSSIFTIQNEKGHSIEEVNRLSIVNILLEHHADANSVDKSGWTPLALASENNSTEIVTTLINHGADQNIHVPSFGGETPLMTAIRKNNLQMLKVLVAAKPDLTLANSQGRTALSYARGYRDEEMIAILKKAGAVH
jgi:ankyrin repeat protein